MYSSRDTLRKIQDLSLDSAGAATEIAVTVQQQADIDKEIAAMEAKMEELAKKKARINAHMASKEASVAQREAASAMLQMSTQDLQLAFNAFGAIYQVFAMIAVAGSLIAGFALTPIAEMDMTAAPEILRLLTLTTCLVVIVGSCFTVYIACDTIIRGTKVAYRENKSVDDVWQAFLVMGRMATFSMYFVNLSYASFLFAGVSISWIKVLEYWNEPSDQRRYGVMLSVVGGVVPLIGFFCVRVYIRDQFHDVESRAGIGVEVTQPSGQAELRSSTADAGPTTPSSIVQGLPEGSFQTKSGTGDVKSGQLRKRIRFSDVSGDTGHSGGSEDGTSLLEMSPIEEEEEEAATRTAVVPEGGLRVGHKSITVRVEPQVEDGIFEVTTYIVRRGRALLKKRVMRRFTEFETLHNVYLGLGGHCTWPPKPSTHDLAGFITTDTAVIADMLTEYMNAVLAVEFFEKGDAGQSLGYLVPESVATANFLEYALSDWSNKYEGNQLRAPTA